ncbi:MBL fold metallo-hydrolase [Puia sp. P3]|uniref:MBL fold metallo-hydrolase n=1 Tax=Puia sp. P3 TaxID=3423952 RepID=UPI003D663D20
MIDNICATCGTQYPQGEVPDVCPICSDDRQFVPESGQVWTSGVRLQQQRSVLIRQLYPEVYEIKVLPDFAIGQRAFLILTPGGNLLWDCIPLLSEQLVSFIRSKGGLKAIAFSHPHYYSNMNEWASTFDCPVYIHGKDDEWIFNKGPRISVWEGGEKPLWEGMKVIHMGGHFPGSAVLHVPSLSPGGTLFVGDTLYIARSRKHIAIQYSYPNHIPLPAKIVREIFDRLLRVGFDTMHGAFDFQNLAGNAREVLGASVGRYVV